MPAAVAAGLAMTGGATLHRAAPVGFRSRTGGHFLISRLQPIPACCNASVIRSAA